MEDTNAPSASDSLQGLVAIDQEVALFNFGNVLVRRNLNEVLGVRIISGGAAGLEPAFAGYVGKGMLTAAVQGENAVAPTSKLILRTIRELSLNNFPGVLVLVQGGSGNLLNFGLAVERAVNDGLQVKLLAVNDDCTNKKARASAKRGLSGIVLLIKIAGAMAELGISMTSIHELCLKITGHLKSVFVAIDLLSGTGAGCHCVDKNTVLPTMKDLCKNLVENSGLKDFGEADKDRSVVLLLDNAGGVSKGDELQLVKEIIAHFQSVNAIVERFYSGCFVSSVQGSKGVSLTILNVFDKDLVVYLDAACRVPAWKSSNQRVSISLDNYISGFLRRRERLSPSIKGPKLNEYLAQTLETSVQFACDALVSCERQLNTIDAELGDGDAGTRLKRTADVLNKRLRSNKLITDHPFTFFESLSKVLESAIGGTSGCIYSIMFEAAAKCFSAYDEDTVITPQMWLKSLETASETLKKYGNIEFGDQTLYDPIFGCCEVVRKEFEDGSNYLHAFGQGVMAAEEIAKNTKQPNCKYPDSGAHAVGIWMRAVYEAVKLKCS